MTRLRAASIAFATLAAARVASACPWCRPAVEADVFGPDFWTNVGIAILPFAVIAPIVVLVERLSGPRKQE